jgi:UDP-N-acetylglucosamine 2-epimerase (non-hydrolysing)
MKVTLIAGARPNFIKISPLLKAFRKEQANGKNIQFRLVHTGQHYDENMSNTFFKELRIPEPDVNLGCGSGTQAQQTASIMVAFEKELTENPTDLVIVVGDVTSTMACSIVAKKLNTKVAHVEAGIRSYDLTMPEEINRMVTDCLSDYYFTTTEWASQNLLKSGVDEKNIFLVGNVMIDTLMEHRDRFKKPEIWDQCSLERGKYLVMTLHRPSNVDDEDRLKATLENILASTEDYPIIFPMHPRTAKVFKKLLGNIENLERLKIVDPLGYLEFNYLVENAKAVITDSGGITEETTVMGIPCLTLRDNTERPETKDIGTNELVGTNPENIKPHLKNLFSGNWKKGSIPEWWDGKSAERIVNTIMPLKN